MMPDAKSATPLDACPRSESPLLRSDGTLTPNSTSANARTGAQTIGSLTVSQTCAARFEWRVALGDVDPATGLPMARPRSVPGTTTKLMTSAAIATETAPALPNRPPRIAGPMKGAAGEDAINAANTLSLSEERNAKRNRRNTRLYIPTMAAHIATANGTSASRAERDVPIVPTKSAIGTAYDSTIRLRTDASPGPKSWRQAAVNPSNMVTTIG